MAGNVFLCTKLALHVFFLLLVDRIIIKIQSGRLHDEHVHALRECSQRVTIDKLFHTTMLN